MLYDVRDGRHFYGPIQKKDRKYAVQQALKNEERRAVQRVRRRLLGSKKDQKAYRVQQQASLEYDAMIERLIKHFGSRERTAAWLYMPHELIMNQKPIDLAFLSFRAFNTFVATHVLHNE